MSSPKRPQRQSYPFPAFLTAHGLSSRDCGIEKIIGTIDNLICALCFLALPNIGGMMGGLPTYTAVRRSSTQHYLLLIIL